MLPNNESIASTKKGQLPLSPNLTKAAKTAQILPQLASSSLISLGQLCDDDCIVLLHKKVLLAIKNKEVILQGIRNPIDQLWDIPVSKEIITEGNYPMPSIYPGIYPTRTRNLKKKETVNILKARVTIDNTFKQQLSNFADIIDENIIDNFL